MLKMSSTLMNRRKDMSAHGLSNTLKGPLPVENGLSEIKSVFIKDFFIFNWSLINWNIFVSPRRLRLKDCDGCNSKTVGGYALLWTFLLVLAWGTHSQVCPSIWTHPVRWSFSTFGKGFGMADKPIVLQYYTVQYCTNRVTCFGNGYQTRLKPHMMYTTHRLT